MTNLEPNEKCDKCGKPTLTQELEIYNGVCCDCAEEPSLIPRKFEIGQTVKTESGTIAKVIGSALYGIVDNKPLPNAWVEYRLQSEGSKRTFYRRESELTSVTS